MKIEIWTDGSSNIEEGYSGHGFVIYKDGSQFMSHAEGNNIGLTNNEEEYGAIICAIDYLDIICQKDEPESVKIYTDSELVVRQVSGAYKTNKAHLVLLRDKIRDALRDSPYEITISHVKREFNKEADAKAREGLKMAESMV